MVLTVLVVEDEALIALNLISILEDCGHRVIGPAATSEQALALAKEHRPDLAFVDLNLTDGLVGAYVASALAAEHATLVVVTSATPQGVCAGEAGVFRIVQKPYREQSILEVVTRAEADCSARRAQGGMPQHRAAARH